MVLGCGSAAVGSPWLTSSPALVTRPPTRYTRGMNPILVHVHVQVKPDCVDAFKSAVLANARASRQEPGVIRFDVLQQADDPARFILIEEYRSADAVAAHKATPHYAAWRDAVAPMMAVARTSIKYSVVE